MPKRIQLSRKPGWRMPADAVKVDRSTKWGNPFRADKPPPEALRPGGPRTAAEAFDWWLEGRAFIGQYEAQRQALLGALGELRGRDLACWCRPGDDCHGDVLMKWANAETLPAATPCKERPAAKHGLPALALSVRQPWAHAIIYFGKDIENRSWQAVNHGLRQRGRIAIHAAKGMTKAEYDEARNFIDRLGYCCPDPHALRRGGIIGTVEVVDVVGRHDSPWFFGPRGLVLRDPQPCNFIPAKGALGYFEWTEADANALPDTPRWMLPQPPKLIETIKALDPEPDLFR